MCISAQIMTHWTVLASLAFSRTPTFPFCKSQWNSFSRRVCELRPEVADDQQLKYSPQMSLLFIAHWWCRCLAFVCKILSLVSPVSVGRERTPLVGPKTEPVCNRAEHHVFVIPGGPLRKKTDSNHFQQKPTVHGNGWSPLPPLGAAAVAQLIPENSSSR